MSPDLIQIEHQGRDRALPDAILAELLEIESMRQRGVAPGRLRSADQILSTGMMQRALPCSSTTRIEQLRPASSGRVSRSERASLMASICAAISSAKSCTP